MGFCLPSEFSVSVRVETDNSCIHVHVLVMNINVDVEFPIVDLLHTSSDFGNAYSK